MMVEGALSAVATIITIALYRRSFVVRRQLRDAAATPRDPHSGNHPTTLS